MIEIKRKIRGRSHDNHMIESGRSEGRSHDNHMIESGRSEGDQRGDHIMKESGISEGRSHDNHIIEKKWESEGRGFFNTCMYMYGTDLHSVHLKEMIGKVLQRAEN